MIRIQSMHTNLYSYPVYKEMKKYNTNRMKKYNTIFLSFVQLFWLANDMFDEKYSKHNRE